MTSHTDLNPSNARAGLVRSDHDAYVSTLPPAPRPAGDYIPVTRAGNLLFTAGHTHAVCGSLSARGAMGSARGPDLKTARECARLAVRNCLASLAHYLGGLRNVEGAVQMTGYVTAAPDFELHPRVLDGASEELVLAFGEQGRPARAAVGVASLPDGAVVEISLVVAVAGLPASAG
ncbi:RidA family protein [Sinomonas sp. P10A9]|uniref:RidA family protein n=1 Tax=Sinomonas puerhi TaxID=3238584 RepID=A0AB39L2Q5_9MICC